MSIARTIVGSSSVSSAGKSKAQCSQNRCDANVVCQFELTVTSLLFGVRVLVIRLTVADLNGLPVTHEEVIPESYLDEFGHVNVMWYSYFFSCATGNFFAHHGMSAEYFIQRDAGAFALEAHVRYLAELRVGTRVTVRSRAVGRSEKRFHNLHFVVNEDDGVISATGEFVGAHIDMKHRRMAPLPPDVALALDRLIDEHNRLGWDPPLCGTMKP